MNQTKIEPTLSDLQVTVESQTVRIAELVTTYKKVDISPFSSAIKKVLALCAARLEATDLPDWKTTVLLTLDISVPPDCDGLRQSLRMAISNGSLVFDQRKFARALLEQFGSHLEFTDAVLFRFDQIAQKSTGELAAVVSEETNRSQLLKGYYAAVRRMLTGVFNRRYELNENEKLNMIQAFLDMAFVRMLLDQTDVATKIMWEDANGISSPETAGAILSCIALTEVTYATLIQTERKVE